MIVAVGTELVIHQCIVANTCKLCFGFQVCVNAASAGFCNERIEVPVGSWEAFKLNIEVGLGSISRLIWRF